MIFKRLFFTIVFFEHYPIFYDNKEWILHFAEGSFSFCEPYGVSFHFKDEEPILIENLEDAEEI